MKQTSTSILEQAGLRITHPRLLVLQALSSLGKPSSQKEIYEHINASDESVNLVTIYRTIECFEEHGIIHKHPLSGGFSICTLQEAHGHHVLLCCDSCGAVKEESDSNLCKQENLIAKRAGFVPKHHVSEIIGLCSLCQ